MVGRKREQNILENCLQSGWGEFLVVYGRRRIGKTYLIREYFNNNFSFYATGVANEKTRAQLKAFNGSLQEYGADEKNIPDDWYEAFARLKKLLCKETTWRDPVSGKRVLFLDEVPWMDTARSDFKSALEYFWNSWASAQKDLLLIVCGSATSWIIENLLGDRGGFYNRITRQIHLMPFTLGECEELFAMNGNRLSRQQIIEYYMVFGGVPYYLNCIDKRLSLAQNIDELLFRPTGQLYYEYDRLMGSLFKNYEKHTAVINAISEKKSGIKRTELSCRKEIGDGNPLTKVLRELEECGFIRKYKNYAKSKNDAYYQVIDPFLLFCYRFVKKREHESWMSFINTPGYYAWEGNAFELVCLLHTAKIKQVLGIAGVETAEYAWASAHSTPGAQIDLLIDRGDGIINICEAKFTTDPFEISDAYAQVLRNKMATFSEEIGCRKALHLTIIASNGIKRNKHSDVVQNVITGEELFTGM